MIRCAASVAYILAIAASVDTRPAVVSRRCAAARHQEARRIELRRHVGDRRPHHLLLGERRAELPAPSHMLDRRRQRTLRHAVRRRAHRDAEGIERLHGQLEAPAHLADHRIRRHPAPREPEPPDGVRDRHRDRRQLQPRRIALDQERRDPLAAQRRVRVREDHVVVRDRHVGDERLLPVEHPRGRPRAAPWCAATRRRCPPRARSGRRRRCARPRARPAGTAAAAPRCPRGRWGYEPSPCTAKMASASGETWPSASRMSTSDRTSTCCAVGPSPAPP